jgi:predicted RNase H-like HicB family nuclease
MQSEVEERLRNLQERLEGLEVSRGAVTLYVATFAPEPYVVRRPIPVVLQQQDENSFLASFMDANISSAGDTQQEAYSNLKELILDVFDSLRALPASRLGPKPARQLAVLREFVDAAQDHQRARREDRQEAQG